MDILERFKVFLEREGASMATDNVEGFTRALDAIDLGLNLDGSYPSMTEHVARRKAEFYEAERRRKDLEKASRDYKEARRRPGASGYSQQFEDMARDHAARHDPESDEPPEPFWWQYVPAIPKDGSRNDRWRHANRYWNNSTKEQRAELVRLAKGEGEPDGRPSDAEVSLSYPSMTKGKDE